MLFFLLESSPQATVMNNRTDAKVAEEFSTFIQKCPNSIFFGTRGGTLYREHNSRCLAPYLNDDFFMRYLSLSSRIEKTLLQDEVHDNLLLNGYQYFTYTQSTDGVWSFSVCNVKESRPKMHAYIFNRAISYKKKRHLPTESTAPDATISNLLPFLPYQHNNTTISNPLNLPCYQNNNSISIPASTLEDDEFKTIPEIFKRYVHHVFNKMFTEHALLRDHENKVGDHERQLFLELINNSNDIMDNSIADQCIDLSSIAKPTDVESEPITRKPTHSSVTVTMDETNDQKITDAVTEPTIPSSACPLTGTLNHDNVTSELLIDPDESTSNQPIVLQVIHDTKKCVAYDLTSDHLLHPITSTLDNKVSFEFPFFISHDALYKSTNTLPIEISHPFYVHNQGDDTTIANKEVVLQRYSHESIVSVKIYDEDIERLRKPVEWLNDNLIAFFLQWSLRFHESTTIQQRWKVFGCPFWVWTSLYEGEKQRIEKFFHPVINIFKYDLIIMQINWSNNHWALVVIVNHSKIVNSQNAFPLSPEIVYFDSLKASDKRKKIVKDRILSFLNDEYNYWFRKKRTNPLPQDHLLHFHNNNIVFITSECKSSAYVFTFSSIFHAV